MAETNLGRVQGGGFFYSSANENTVVNKTTLTPNNIPALLGDHILFNTGKVYKITKVDSTNVNCVYETSIKGPQGNEGVTFTPSVSTEGVISWTNNGKLSNPTPVNIKGPKGDKGDKGVTFTPSVSTEGVISWTNNGKLSNPTPVNIKGPKGTTGSTFTPSVSTEGVISWTNNGGLSNPTPVNIKGPKGDMPNVSNKAEKTFSNVTYPTNVKGQTKTGTADRVIKTYVSSDGFAWYRVWQSGWKECGGHIVSNANIPANGAISMGNIAFNGLSFSNTNYNTTFGTEWRGSQGGHAFGYTVSTNKKNTYMQVQIQNTNQSIAKGNVGIYWKVEGF